MKQQTMSFEVKLPETIGVWATGQAKTHGMESAESYLQLIIRMAWQCQKLGLTPIPAQVTQKHVLTQDSSMQDLEGYE